jgi:hypothetical protein
MALSTIRLCARVGIGRAHRVGAAVGYCEESVAHGGETSRAQPLRGGRRSVGAREGSRCPPGTRGSCEVKDHLVGCHRLSPHGTG